MRLDSAFLFSVLLTAPAGTFGADSAAPVLVERTTPILPQDWNDALARNSDGAAPAAVEKGAEKPYPQNVANFVIQETDDAARLVILQHLKEIETSGQMSREVITDGYWRAVFVRLGYGDIYEASRGLLKRALRAGLKPYRDGKTMTAKAFAELAAQTLQPPPALTYNLPPVEH